MKPILMIVKEINGDTIKISKSELEKVVDRAYEAGRTDGYDAGRKESNLIYTTTDKNIHTTPYYTSAPQITCDDRVTTISSM